MRRIDARPGAGAAFYSMRRYRNRQAELTCVQRGTIPGAGREAVTACVVAAGAVERTLSGGCSVCVPTRTFLYWMSQLRSCGLISR